VSPCRAAEAEAAADEAAAATTLRRQEGYAALAECALTLLQAGAYTRPLFSLT